MATSKIHVTTHGNWGIQVKAAPKKFPHRFEVLLFPCHFEVVDVDGQEELAFTVHVKAFPAWHTLETGVEEGLLAVLFPVESSKRMAIEIQPKLAHGILDVPPRSWSLRRRSGDPGFDNARGRPLLVDLV